MKTTISFWKRMPVIMMAVISCAFLVTSCDKDNDDDNNMNQRTYTLSGDASGAQVVPAVSGTGTATISGTYDPNTMTLTYTSNWNGLTATPTSAGFYYGASGTSGTSVGTPWTIPTTATATGSTSGTMTLTNEQASQLTAGNWYYVYNTPTNTTGEVRGQITATQNP